MISILVITTVVWLAMVFLSISSGLQRIWVTKLIALDAPVHIKPTQSYFESYYHQIDAVSLASNFQTRTLAEKTSAEWVDPYDANADLPLPEDFPASDLENGQILRDPVKGVLRALQQFPEVQWANWTSGYADCQIRTHSEKNGPSTRLLNQLGIVCPMQWTPALHKALQPILPSDWKEILRRWFLNNINDSPNAHSPLLRRLGITHLSTQPRGWALPSTCWPNARTVRALLVGEVLHVCANSRDFSSLRARMENQHNVEEIEARFCTEGIEWKGRRGTPQLFLHANTWQATMHSTAELSDPMQLRFNIEGCIQGILVRTSGKLADWEIARVELKSTNSDAREMLCDALNECDGQTWKSATPTEEIFPVLLPLAFRQNGAQIGDLGAFQRSIQSPSGEEIERISLLVCGFFDPGMMPLGNRLMLTHPHCAQLIHEALPDGEKRESVGIWVYCPLDRAREVAQKCRESLREAGLAEYWNVQSFEEFDHVKVLIDQLKSDQLLLTLLAVIIVGVACSNIVSLLLLLVFEKRREVAILRALGASPGCIARIFSLCGLIAGSFGCLFGAILAWLTLTNIDALVGILSALQGRQLLHPQFYGNQLPDQLTYQAVAFTLAITAILSAFAALVPAIHAARLHPSRLLKNL